MALLSSHFGYAVSARDIPLRVSKNGPSLRAGPARAWPQIAGYLAVRPLLTDVVARHLGADAVCDRTSSTAILLVAPTGSFDQRGDLIEQADHAAIVALKALKLLQKGHGSLAIEPAGLFGC